MSSLASSTLRKKRLKLLETSINKCRLDLSLKKKKTAREVLSYLGVPHERFPSLALDEQLTIGAYNQHIAFPLDLSLREVLKKEAEDERLANSNRNTDSVNISSNIDSSNHDKKENGQGRRVDENLPTSLPIVDSIGPIAPACAKEIELKASYPISLYYHQVTAVKEAYWKLIQENKRAILLQAGVGTGKTFIYGALLAELWQTGFFEGKTFSPWPALVITKASIITQTERVLEKHFKLCPKRQFKVLNYDALRSGRGLDSVMEKKKEVVNGEIVTAYKWKKYLHPLVVIVDECQNAKNEDSTQSQIIQNLADIQEDNLKIVFSSATPWTRVCEAKYFCVNLGMEYKIA